MRYLYSFLFYLLLPLILLRLFWRARRAAAYRSRIAERFGFCPYQLEKCIWLHSVSVGETIAAIPMVKTLQKQYPNIPFLITNMTPTGAARVKAAFGDSVLQAYIPYDIPDAMMRFLKKVNPLICIIMETELWPNLFASCKKQNIPVLLANARLSAKSAKGYSYIPTLTREMLQIMTTCCIQAQADANRFLELGLPKERCIVTGNIKFDIEPPADLAEKSAVLRQQLGQDRMIWIAASTHPTEEEIMLAAHRKIGEQHPRALLIIVPRHPERFDAIAAMCAEQGFSVARRSQNQPCTAETQVYLGDTMGELLLMYSAADVAFVAGSFAQIGGHNMLEPAVLSKPIVMGPQLYNFAEASTLLLNAKGMVLVENGDALAKMISQLFSHPAEQTEMGKRAKQVVEANRGALAKQLAAIETILNTRL